jgi:lipoate---protein ligase
MGENWRFVDTGLASPVRNVALNRALLEARAADEIPSTLRFARSTRTVSLAARDSAAQALDLDYCRARQIALSRRITGGAAAYVDERQLLWELYLHRREVGDATLHALGRRICHAAAAGLSALGLDARLRGRAEIEIEGRAVAAGGFAVERDAILFQAALRLDADPAMTLAVLRTPWSGDAGALASAAATRVGDVADALGHPPDVRAVKDYLVQAFESEFGVELREGDLGLSEHERCVAALPAIESRDWVDSAARPASDAPLLAAVHRALAGTLTAAVIYERATRTLSRVWLTGGCAFKPERLCADLEAALCDVPLDRVDSRIESFFGSRPVDAGGYTAADFAEVVKRAVRQPLLAG